MKNLIKQLLFGKRYGREGKLSQTIPIIDKFKPMDLVYFVPKPHCYGSLVLGCVSKPYIVLKKVSHNKYLLTNLFVEPLYNPRNPKYWEGNNKDLEQKRDWSFEAEIDDRNSYLTHLVKRKGSSFNHWVDYYNENYEKIKAELIANKMFS